MITLIQLEYITTLDTFRHFATAAEKCFVTQPTLSMQIKKLEDELGVVIFDRTRQPVVPTDQGKQIIAQARLVLQEAGKINLLVQQLKKDIKGELRIGLIPTISPYLLPLFSGDFKRSNPNVQLKLEEAITGQIEKMLIKDQLDVGIVVTPVDNDQIVEMPLYYEEMMIYHSKGHRYENQQQILLNEINTNDMWLLSDGHCFRNQVINLCQISKTHSENLPYQFEGGSLETLIKIINREGGYTLIPELATFEADPGRIKHFSEIKPIREVSLIFTRKFVKSKLIELLAENIIRSVPQYMVNKERGTVIKWR
jgi:LysR family hydrogen peroxide-inducible transcriptional activator